MSRKFDEMRINLNSQLLNAIHYATAEKVIPELQGSIGALENGLNAELDLQSAWLHRNTEGAGIGKTSSKWPKRTRIYSNRNHDVTESSVEPLSNERDYDTRR